MRIAIVYDCIFPHTVGGAERWYRNLAERLDGEHQVTYLTRHQWGSAGPETPFATVAVSPGGELYTRSGRRRIGPPLRFGAGVFWHLLRHGRRYDAVHTASFPYFSLLGAWLALRLTRSRARLIADWHEVWGRDYWRRYLGGIGGRVGSAVQSLCARLPDHSFVFSRLAERGLRGLRHGAPITVLSGEYAEQPQLRAALSSAARPEPPSVIVAGRHIPEKRVPLVPPAIEAARRELPGLTCAILGDGPETEATRERIRELGLEGVVELRGRVDHDEVMRSIAAASCLLHPSEREGYGLVIVEAASLGTPSIAVAEPENAATELIEDGVNGFVAASADPGDLAASVIAAVRGGAALRESTTGWYEGNRERLSIESSLSRVEASYSSDPQGP